MHTHSPTRVLLDQVYIKGLDTSAQASAAAPSASAALELVGKLSSGLLTMPGLKQHLQAAAAHGSSSSHKHKHNSTPIVPPSPRVTQAMLQVPRQPLGVAAAAHRNTTTTASNSAAPRAVVPSGSIGGGCAAASAWNILAGSAGRRVGATKSRSALRQPTIAYTPAAPVACNANKEN